MVVASLEYRHAFTFLETCDDNYNEALTDDDWKKETVVCTFLKLLYDSANTVMTTLDQTANIFFHEAWKIQLELTNGISSEDTIVSSIAKKIHETFDKYWKDCSLVLAIAVVVDPRFKLKLVEFCFSKIYGEDSTKYVKVVNDSIQKLYKEYTDQQVTSMTTYVDHGEANLVNGNEDIQPSTSHPAGDDLLDFDMYVSMSANQSAKSELDHIKYPCLSTVARDVLAIPVSMVNPGYSIFDAGTGSRMLDDYRSSLCPETVEALFCAKDWLQYLSTLSELPSTAIVQTDF
ncbi:zinc finger BED domain-containing protein RICESLEEPER 2-like [Zingiber officinale]|uniref:zinc finger BED domain-containing protein RICESLEEPER 2-like n=1 Tax=Zingiber officinale TaxID=94328 RepID=UPI001C4D288E|nr:zinc finger BED domain-containing protein RICESLEEPER 2-like [Zingiber officinale]